MTHKEMSNFTNEELSKFNHLELSLKNTELLQNLINDFREDIPASIILKLETICQDFIASCEKSNIKIPPEIAALKNKKTLTVGDILSILQVIIAIISLVTSNEENIHNTYINQVTNYVINENYVTDTDIIINDFYNVSIDMGKPSNNPDSPN